MIVTAIIFIAGFAAGWRIQKVVTRAYILRNGFDAYRREFHDEVYKD